MDIRTLLENRCRRTQSAVHEAVCTGPHGTMDLVGGSTHHHNLEVDSMPEANGDDNGRFDASYRC